LPGFSSRAPEADAVPSGRWRSGWVIVGIGTLIAFWLGYVYTTNHSLRFDWAQSYLSPAVNYACTGRFGAVRLNSEATPADHVALEALADFLKVGRLEFSCDAFPQHVVPTGFFDGIDAANAEQPLYLILLYALPWRWLGVHWTVTYVVVAATVAASFLLMYGCMRRFAPTALAATAALLFVASPFFITNVLSPRDALKFPFVVGIAALLIGGAGRARAPVRVIAFAGLAGLLIGIGYGFRSDILFLLAPAVLIGAVLAPIDLRAIKAAAPRIIGRKLSIRLSAVAALLLGFAAGAWMPLVNDHVLHDTYGDVGYGPLAMGLLGHTRYDLYQRHSLIDGMYMFRNAYNNDLSVGVRVMEFAARQGNENVDFAAGRYWTYAKRYYWRIASLVPADLVAGAIGAFVNLMTVPRSLLDRHSQAWRYDRMAPWTSAYAFGGNESPSAAVLRLTDQVHAAAASLSADFWFAANLVVLFVFLWLIVSRLGFRAAVAAVILLGATLAIASFKFEMRHVFYLFAFTAVAWTSVLWLVLRVLWAPVARLRGRAGGVDRARIAMSVRRAAASAARVAVLLAATAAVVYATLLAARAYQVEVLRALIADWSTRGRIPAQYGVSELPSGQSLIRILSPLPLSTGGERAPDAPITSVVELGVVAVTFDGNACADRRIMVSAVGDSDVPLPETTYLMREIFSVTLDRGGDYVAILPAFNYAQPGKGKVIYAGIELGRQDVPCVKGVSTLAEFKPHDVLFDFFLPADPGRLKPDDLFQRVYLPGLGFI